MTGMYMTEIAPSRIRGFLLIFYSAWYGIGQLCASLALKVSNDQRPMDYLTPIYTEWAMMVSDPSTITDRASAEWLGLGMVLMRIS